MIRFIHLLVMIVMLCKTSFSAQPKKYPKCSSSCGHIRNITAPFRLTTDPINCGNLRYNLSCENNRTVLYLPDGYPRHYFPFKNSYNYMKMSPSRYLRYHVQTINYNNYTIRLVDPNIQKDDCSSIPKNTLTYADTRDRLDYDVTVKSDLVSTNYFGGLRFNSIRQLSKTVIFFHCENPVSNSSYIDANPCTFNHSNNVRFYYYVYEGEFGLKEVEDSCGVDQLTLVTIRDMDVINSSYDVHNALVYGFELSWLPSFAKTDEKVCYVDDKDSNRIQCERDCAFKISPHECGLINTIAVYLTYYIYYAGGKYILELLAPRTIIGFSFVIGLMIYKWRRRHLSIYDGIEQFLESNNNLMPIRYSYREIKKMSRGFKNKLGAGGFGTVYHGKLRSGRFVAIKILSNSKGSGQDFINEVATIGRIHHVNVVRLVGFCVEGTKRALLYDFMPNGSLDKYIFSRDEAKASLSSAEIFKISQGVAHGIEYLHQGCEVQILHFDIKPHNVLLDENFVPKVSDFGLARLCPLERSVVYLTGIRGTIGYIAPELIYNISRKAASYKSDVYSFGMLLMEMANQRKNLNPKAQNSSQIYFPTWAYDQLSKGKGIETEEYCIEDEPETFKKMIIVALWCIQFDPCDRPSMHKVIEMLEGKVELIEMPPKPYFYPQNSQNAEDVTELSRETSETETFIEDSDEISLVSNRY